MPNALRATSILLLLQIDAFLMRRKEITSLIKRKGKCKRFSSIVLIYKLLVNVNLLFIIYMLFHLLLLSREQLFNVDKGSAHFT